MKRYIEILLGGKRYRFLIDEELDKGLKSALKSRYQFDNNDTLVLDDSDLVNSYQVKQLILKSILNQINTYELDSDLQNRIDTLKRYVDSKNTVYSSDLTNLESVLGEASEIYAGVSNNLAKKENLQNRQEKVEENIIEETTEKVSDDIINSDIGTKDESVNEFKAILDDISYDEDLRSEVPINDIKEAIDRIEICDSIEEFVDKTSSNDTYDVKSAIKNKNEKIILPPNTSLSDVVGEVIKTYVNNDIVLEKIVTYVERKSNYINQTNKALESLRSSLKISGFSARNLNYFGDQFFDAFESICKESGMSFEAMFADYFNGYSANRKYNSPMDKFLRLFTKYNGGDENTRALLEAMLVKKAMARHLISTKYNRYLSDEYRNLSVNSNGYINFDNNMFQRINAKGGTLINEVQTNTSRESIDSIDNKEIKANNNSYESELNISSTKGLGGIDTPNISDNFDGSMPKNNETNKKIDNKIDGNTNVEASDNLVLQANQAMNRRNKMIQGSASVVEKATGSLTNQQRPGISRVELGGAFTKNSEINTSIDSDEEESSDIDSSDSTSSGSGGGMPPSDNGDKTSDDFDDNLDNDDQSQEINKGNIPNEISGENLGDALKNKAKNKILAFIKKNPVVLVIAGIIIFVLFLLIIIVASEQNKKDEPGYYDNQCNFNETKVVLASCNGTTESQSLELEDYIIKMTYLYIKDGKYSDEAIKALMILLKTNTLSYGGYNSSSKSVDVRLCDIYSGSVSSFSDVFDGYEEKEKDLSKLYNSISEYLFVSDSYKSSISSLGTANIINVDSNTLNNLEKEAQSDKSYEEILTTLYGGDNTEDVTVYRDTLYIGDSRTHGILNASYINNSNTVYGDGYGYSWFVGSSTFSSSNTNAVNGAIKGINERMRAGASYNIVIWLGVNDLGNINSYISKYKELASGEWATHNIYVVAVGPVNDDFSVYAKNETINNFNNTMRNEINNSGLSNLHFIDLGYNESSIDSYDSAGIHYSNSDYKKIYDIISSNLDNELSSNLVLYRLSDYCTYFNLTYNDTYWWPIGSKEATQGNVYGGAPVSVTITSTFGPRIHPIDGIRKGHGAIDIAAPRKTPVIATKDGVVNKAVTGCVEGNQACGGGYGNYIKIEHSEGIESLYAHLTSLEVKEGDVVTQGQIIGYSGSTGKSTGPHLHFEIRVDGTKVDPLNYVSADNPRPINFAVTNIVGDIKVVGDTGDYSNRAKNKQIVCESLLASGFSTNATVGIMANMESESAHTYDPHVVEYGSGYTYQTVYNAPASKAVGLGLIQWSFGRRVELVNYAKSKGWDPASMGAQLNFLYYEISQKSAYAVTNKYITGNYSANDIAVAFCKNFERPGGSVANLTTADHCTNRASSNVPAMETYVKNGCKG